MTIEPEDVRPGGHPPLPEEKLMWIWLSFAAAGAVVVLCWNLYSRYSTSRITAILDRRRATSRMVSSGELVDGNRHVAVALSLTDSDFFYENSDMNASIDLRWVREIEYDTSLTTGQRVAAGKVLRIRSVSQLFEFVIPDELVPRWHMVLPARQRGTA